jgi:sigma-B regulation protein RsbU (phosphoserine phosphatase)
MKNKNLSFRLSIYFLISETIFSVFIILIGYNYVRRTAFENYGYRLQYDVLEALGEVQNSMDEAVRITENLAIDYSLGLPPNNLQEYIEVAFKVHVNLFELEIVTTSASNHSLHNAVYEVYRSPGITKSGTGRFDSISVKMNEWKEQMLYATKPAWGPPFYNSKIESRLISYARPLDFYRRGKLLHATLFCTISLDRGLENLRHQKMIKSGFSILINEQNLIVYHTDSTKTGKEVGSLIRSLDGSKFDIAKLLNERISGTQIIHPDCMKNKRTVAIYWPIKFSNWFIISLIPESLFMSEFNQITLVLILLILLIGSITAAVMIYLSIRLVSPISVLADDSRRIMEEAGFDPVDHLNDIEVLSDSIVKMKEHMVSYRKHTLQNTNYKEEIEKELNLAKDIEMGMVPTKFPLFPGRRDFECYGRLIPAKIVGGDLFDVFLLDDKQLFISICDTLGKGIPAAMFSVIARTYIRSIANPITILGKMMESLNYGLSLGHDSDMFATVILLKLNLKTGELIYCNAGHPHPIILRNNNRVEVLSQSHGIPVGVKGNQQFSESSIVLAPGESLIIYTDGVTEDYNEQGDFFGTERLISILHPLRELSTQSIVNNSLDALERFRGRAEVHDDTTLVAIKFLGK